MVTYEVIIEINNQDLKLKPGMTANVEIITAQLENVWLVPNQALRFYMTGESGETKRYKDKGLWVLGKNSLPQRVVIETGVADDDYTEVSGKELNAQTVVIVEEKTARERLRSMRMRMPR